MPFSFQRLLLISDHELHLPLIIQKQPNKYNYRTTMLAIPSKTLVPQVVFQLLYKNYLNLFIKLSMSWVFPSLSQMRKLWAKPVGNMPMVSHITNDRAEMGSKSLVFWSWAFELSSKLSIILSFYFILLSVRFIYYLFERARESVHV